MSDQPGNNGDRKPLSKRQKCGNGDQKEATAEIIAFGGPMYDEATARRMLKELVRVPAERADDGEAEIGFDPDDAALNNVYGSELEWTTPMVHFAREGDAKMCRYLLSKGASTTKLASWRPMYAAALEGHLEVCKFLHANGASRDIWEKTPAGWTPFNVAVHNGHDELVRWLVLQGALCANDSSEEIEERRIFPNFCYGNISTIFARDVRVDISHKCKLLVGWAEEVTQSHSALVMFLLGTLPPAPDTVQSRALQCLSGHPGVRKNIGDFVGLEVTKGKQLRILRQVVDVLPSFIETDEEE